MEFQNSIVWFRRDLRFFDNVALNKACLLSQKVIPVFIFDEMILNKISHKSDKRVQFIFETLTEMHQELREQGKSMIILYGDPVVEIPKIALEYNVNCVFTNTDYETYAIARDLEIKNRLSERNIEFKSFKDQVIFEKEENLKKNKQPYVMFTPFKNEWLKRVKDTDFKTYAVDLKKIIDLSEIKNANHTFHWDIQKIGFYPTECIFKSGRKSALECVKKFTNKINLYASERDFFAREGTSQLSIHLRFGTISIREAFQFAKKFNSQGADTWINELIWREFYKMILSQFPYVEQRAFKKECQFIQWENNEEYFDKWKQGMTGFPIVDAAMRHFNATGWMHNRLRMVVASFLTKDLLIDYKKGEQYFAEKLLDFDLSANNGGWQWSASTGCDAQPYFRVFNPESQSIKFDPSGSFIKKHCPELAGCDQKEIHAPYRSQIKLFNDFKNYPKPIVEHDKQRLKAIVMFKST